MGRLHYHTGYWMLRGAVCSWLKKAIAHERHFDLCWVDGGEMLGTDAIAVLKKCCGRIVLFNHDDPTGPRDWRRFMTLRSAIPAYDLCTVVRKINVHEYSALGARRVLRVFRSYDEVAHAPRPERWEIDGRLRSDVCFIGANYKGEDRDRFLAGLIDRGLDLAIWGDHWQRSSVWDRIKGHYRGGSLTGQDYVDAIQGAKLCLGFLAKRNRDEHTTRSMEIPYAGGVLCAQRTPEHRELYCENGEAVFWNNVDECHAACVAILSDEEQRQKIRSDGMRRVRKNKVGNEDLIAKVLAQL